MWAIENATKQIWAVAAARVDSEWNSTRGIKLQFFKGGSITLGYGPSSPLASRFNATRTAACLRECADIRNVHQEPVVKQQKIVAIFVVSTLHSMSFDLVRFFKVS